MDNLAFGRSSVTISRDSNSVLRNGMTHSEWHNHYYDEDPPQSDETEQSESANQDEVISLDNEENQYEDTGIENEESQDDQTNQEDKTNYEDETFICPSNEEADKAFPPDMPQNLIFESYNNFKFPEQSARPFLGPDVWFELADNKRVFFLRPHSVYEDTFPTIANLTAWVASRSHPITLLINNQLDKSFPDRVEEKELWTDFLDQPNLHALFAYNVRRWEEYPKLKPLPIGLKWNWWETMLFSEEKEQTLVNYLRIATSPEESKELFDSKRGNNSIYVRYFTSRNKGKFDDKENKALEIHRPQIPDVLNRTAPLNIVSEPVAVSPDQYFKTLKQSRFVICPPGGGLDTHCTWEAFITGTIPILPSSPLDPQFEGLPVWLVSDWNEVTDEAAEQKSEELASMTFNWKFAYAVGWREKIYEGLCQLG